MYYYIKISQHFFINKCYKKVVKQQSIVTTKITNDVNKNKKQLQQNIICLYQ
jgi:hypothetical protein